MGDKYPGMNFLNSSEIVMGRILLNDSKAQTTCGTPSPLSLAAVRNT